MTTLSIDDFMASRKMRCHDYLTELLRSPSHSMGDALRYSVLGSGKRFRPLLVYAAGESLGVAPEVLDPIAAAVELIHIYSLVHDDLPAMDDDDIRHGKPSCHKAFGEAMAILTGDALQSLAMKELTDERRELLVLSKFQGVKYEQIAKIKNTSVSNIKVQVHRTIKELKDVYFKLED